MKPEYLEKYRDKPDYVDSNLIKNGKRLDFTVFANQDVISIEGSNANIISSSNIFTPHETIMDGEKTLYEPDFECIEISGNPMEIFNMIMALKGLYQDENNWTIRAIDEQLDRIEVEPLTDRFGEDDIWISEPSSLITKAKEVAGLEGEY
jgi:hypothetical protein